MTTLMKLENISELTPVEIMSVDSGDLLLGRDTENSVVIDETAISRVHGNIFAVAGYWFFRDLNSTNGSAINGEKVSPEQIRILRDEDIIHLATFPIRYTEVRPKVVSPETGSLLVFLDSGFQSEFNFNSTNSKFTLGGKGADFVLDQLTVGTIALEFEFSSSDLTLKVSNLDRQATVELNGHPLDEKKPYLLDKDEIVVNNYRLIVNLIGLKSPIAKSNEPFLQKKFLEEWQDTSGKSSPGQENRFVFTSTKEDPAVTDTVSMKSSDLMLGVGQFGLSQKMSAVSAAKTEQEEPDPETQQKHVYFGLLVLIISFFAIIILIKVFAT